MTVASSRRMTIEISLAKASAKRHDPWARAYSDDVSLLMYELERVEAELDVMTRDCNAYRASYNAERALRKREREGARGWLGRWLGL